MTYKHDKNRTPNEFHAIRLLRSGSVRYHLTNLSTSVERLVRCQKRATDVQ
ncbi:hypothetical protein HDF16_006052 [Granulicella aggregans]|uniref:Uncharacterized protein n=1 Tax=Granulicella aggregans TaxID=474949 RepID=A0A7W7ZLA9_9BACT|nr:hypothetical protein [Granulicella aggregans]